MEGTSIVLGAEARRSHAGALRRRRDVLARDVHRAAGIENEELLRDLVDALAAAVELETVDGFVHHVEGTAALAGGRGVSLSQLGAVFTALRGRLGEGSSPLAFRCVDAAGLALEAGRFAGAAVDEAPHGLPKERAAYLAAAVAGHWQAAVAVVERALADGHSPLDVYADVIGEALYEVGRLWARGEITVADQHVASAVADYTLSRLYMRSEPDTPRTGSAVVACAPTEAHHTGAHMVADALELDGWDCVFLGAHASTKSVVDAVDESGATLVAVSVALLTAAPPAAQLIETLRARFGARAPRVLVGGSLVRAVPTLWRVLGADGFAADVRGAAGAARAAVA